MTAVEWLKEKYISQNCSLTIIDFDKAKEMHKQEILNAFSRGAAEGLSGDGASNKEQYYNETYKK